MLLGRKHLSVALPFLILLFASSSVASCSALVISMNNLPLDQLATMANSFAAANGVQVEKKHKDSDNSYFECAPISLLPNAYPREAFDQAQEVAPAFNLLVDRISRDGDFLVKTLGGAVAKADPYTAKLLELYKQIYLSRDTKSEFALSADRLGLHRSDYMLNGGMIKQVELNTIASSFGGLSCRVTALHNFLVSRFESQTAEFLEEIKKSILGDDTAALQQDDGVPQNPTLDRLPAAMKVALDSYEKRFSAKNAVILFVVQDGESNTVDQRMIEFELWQQYQIPVIRLSLASLYDAASVDDKTGALMVNGQEVAVVYYRAGYAPTDYPDGYDGVEWQARAKLETSRATKSPSLGYHLAGTKKVQQELARPGVLERFFPSADEKKAVDDMRKAFAGLYSLGDDATEEDLAAVKAVLDGGEGRYVLKPQREGGGYNFYGDQLAGKIKENVEETSDGLKLNGKLGEYILMERLFPPRQKAILLRSGRVEGSGDTISELGCFGTIVCSPAGDVLHNEYAGFLLRTKFSNVDEGGVASGFATLSSPYLCSK